MPNGVSGQDLIRAARQLRPDMKALLTSGYSAQFIKPQADADRGRPAPEQAIPQGDARKSGA